MDKRGAVENQSGYNVMSHAVDSGTLQPPTTEKTKTHGASSPAANQQRFEYTVFWK